MSSTFWALAELVAKTRHCALHLAIREVRTPDDPVRAGALKDLPVGPDGHGDWAELVRGAVGRGVDWRRARIVSEPAGDAAASPWEASWAELPAGEQVRWLPRRRAVDLLLPGSDLWVFDDTLLCWTSVYGDGSFGPHEFSREPELIHRCKAAFEAVWERAVDHADHSPGRGEPEAA